MVGHVAVPALDPSGRPATLSPSLNFEILRDEMGFEGLIVTDAMDMEGVGSAWIGEATVDAVLAGADVILMPPDQRVALQSLIRGVEEGTSRWQRIDRSVRRILEAKAGLGLHENRLVDPAAGALAVARPEDVARASAIAKASITVVSNDGGVLPLAAEEPVRILHLAMPDGIGFPAAEFRTRRIDGRDRSPWDDEVDQKRQRDEILEDAEISPMSWSRPLTIERESPTAWFGSWSGLGKPTYRLSWPLSAIPICFRDLPEVSAYLCAFGASSPSRSAAAAALFGEIDVVGKLPVTLSEEYAVVGGGLEIPRRAMTLQIAEPEDAGFRAGGYGGSWTACSTSSSSRAPSPAASWPSGTVENLVHLQPFGRLSYDDDAPAVEADTIYDLASLTKVVATTTMAMILVDEGRLDLDEKVQDFLPLFQGPGKDRITVRHLLTHRSGIDWWAPLYEDTEGPEEYLRAHPGHGAGLRAGDRLQVQRPRHHPARRNPLPGRRTAAGQFVRRGFSSPWTMTNTHYRPGQRISCRESPPPSSTTGGAGWSAVRSTTRTPLPSVGSHPTPGSFQLPAILHVFAQMLVNGGVLEHHRIVSRETVELFTRRAGEDDSMRALGWDTKSPQKSLGRFVLFAPFLRPHRIHRHLHLDRPGS